MSGIEGQRVVVVGASAGIGRAFAVEAVRQGADVALVARRAERLAEAVAEAGGGTAIVADVAHPDDCIRLAAEALEALGGIDLVLYAAGCSTLRRLVEMEPADWQRVLSVNLAGFNQVVQAMAPAALRPGAVVAALSSEVVGHPQPGLVAYAVSKAALEESVRGWRVEQPELRFCSIGVGATTPTEFGQDFAMDQLGPLMEEWVRRGFLPSAFMETDELAALLITVLGSMLSAPGIGIEHLLLRSPTAPIVDVSEIDAR
jgi:NAD(P)-dependent dehydrogenase (short-subunit alcohol dehydrogenase family)